MYVAYIELDFLDDLQRKPENCDDSNDGTVDDRIGYADKDDGNHSSWSFDGAQERDIYGMPDGRPGDKEVLEPVKQGGQNEVEILTAAAEIPHLPPMIIPLHLIIENGDAEEESESPPTP